MENEVDHDKAQFSNGFNTSSIAWDGLDLHSETATGHGGIPNFSTSVFGITTYIRYAAQFIVVAALVAVILRMFARKRFKMKFWWDDLFVTIAAAFLFANQLLYWFVDSLGRLLQSEISLHAQMLIYL